MIFMNDGERATGGRSELQLLMLDDGQRLIKRARIMTDWRQTATDRLDRRVYLRRTAVL